MRYSIIITLVLLSLTGKSQHAIGFSLGGNFSDVNFTNSNGISYKSLKSVPGIITTVGYTQNLHYNKRRRSVHQIGLEAGYKSNNFKDKESSLITTWNMQFLSTAFIYRYYPDYRKRTGLLFGGGVMYDFLLSGTQTQGFNQFNITQELARSNFSLGLETGINYNISPEATTTLTLRYLRGLLNMEKDPGQKAYVHAFNITATIYFML